MSDSSYLSTCCANNDQELIVNDLQTGSSEYLVNKTFLKIHSSLYGNNTKSILYTPLKANNIIIGVFTIQSCRKNSYSSMEINLFRILADYVSIAIQNISQRVALEELSKQDNLTGVYNRRGFMDFFKEKISTREGKLYYVGIIMIDLDFFKKINDNFGHLVGDDFLSEVGSFLLSLEEENIKAGRLGGEEFALLVFNKSNRVVENLAEKVRLGVSEIKINSSGNLVQTTTSVGVTNRPFDSQSDYHNLYFEADNALYKAKKNGRNRVEFYLI